MLISVYLRLIAINTAILSLQKDSISSNLRVILSASYSTGKTTVLTGRALKLVTNPNDHSNSANQENQEFIPEKVHIIFIVHAKLVTVIADCKG